MRNAVRVEEQIHTVAGKKYSLLILYHNSPDHKTNNSLPNRNQTFVMAEKIFSDCSPTCSIFIPAVL